MKKPVQILRTNELSLYYKDALRWELLFITIYQIGDTRRKHRVYSKLKEKKNGLTLYYTTENFPAQI